VGDDLYKSLRPMLSVSNGSLICLSTPWGKLGWYHDAWHGSADWTRVKITARQCARISPAFLEEELRELGSRWFSQEYECEFVDVIDCVFSYADIMATMVDAPPPLFGR
jgi:hypothetical protein